ncbi:MAG TPA: BlaI/MecI/CopY family transcriptional regulator [Chryseolinea sp.]|jgi:BlaI family transcriptional regulator, penicillinase repressor|nr:BlaI/MecI/CopY family transcriptional regulator [Chryseolinea sp.]HZB13371.1 BlaI/MecI/CopY family transcriptional regulator [Chryseolinea sp.]
MVAKSLTKAEEQVMQYVWEIQRACLKDVVEKFPEPRPAYTTISTVIRVLVKKGFIGFKTFGKTNEYYPLISKNEYFQQQVTPLLSNYLKGSPSAVVSYFSNAKLNLSELEEIKQLIDSRIKKLKGKKK